nr:60S ribosomal protein L22 [Hymenolepis microstoma]
MVAAGKIVKKSVPKGPTKKQPLRFSIECSAEVIEKDIIDFGFFEKYLRERIKVNGKVKNLGKDVHVERDKTTIHVTSSIPFSKRYLKYLTKKFLKFHNLRDYLHVISTSKTAYQLKFFNFDTEETDDEE